MVSWLFAKNINTVYDASSAFVDVVVAFCIFSCDDLNSLSISSEVFWTKHQQYVGNSLEMLLKIGWLHSAVSQQQLADGGSCEVQMKPIPMYSSQNCAFL